MVATSNIQTLAGASVHFKYGAGGATRGNRTQGKGLGIPFNSEDAPGVGYEQHVERQGRVLHPHAHPLFAFEIKQHALVRGEFGAVHQPLRACLGSLSQLHAQLVKVALQGLDAQVLILACRAGAAQQPQEQQA